MEHYDIVVFKDGRHLFTIYERSTYSLTRTDMLYPIFKEKFPESEGYKVTVIRWERTDCNLNKEEG